MVQIKKFIKISLLLLSFIFLSSLSYAVDLSNVSIIAPTSNSNVSDSIVLNATTVGEANNLTFRWVNGSGIFVYNLTILNTSSSTTFSNESFDTNLLLDGTYTLIANATNITEDGGISGTSVTNILVDNTEPSVAISANDTSIRLTYDSVIIYFNASDAHISNMIFNVTDPNGLLIFQYTNATTIGSINFTAASINVSGTYKASLFVNDTHGNTNTTSLSLVVTSYAATAETTTTTTSSGRSSAITAAGASGLTTAQEGTGINKIWTSISPGIVTTVDVNDDELGLTKLSFKVSQKTPTVSLNVKKLDSLPASVNAFSTPAYRILQIVDSRLQENLDGAVDLEFKVEKAWLAANDLDSSGVALFRYVGEEWTELETTAGSEEGDYVTFTSSTPGFSYFIVGEKSDAVTVTEKDAIAAEEAEKEVVAKAKSTKTAWIILGVIAVVIVGFIFFKRASKRK